MRPSLFIAALAATLILLTPSSAQYNLPRVLPIEGEAGTGSRLGIGLRDIDADRANAIRLGEPRGVEIMQVEEQSPAERSGLKVGDVLLSYNGETIMGAQQLGRLVAETPRGRRVKISYWREGKLALVTAITTAPHAVEIATVPPMDFPEMHDWMPSIPSPTLIWRTPLGFDCESVDFQLAAFFGVKHGVLIRSVSKDSAAGEAGLRAGDVVTQIGTRPVSDPKDIVSYIRLESRSAKAIPMEVMREHKAINVKIAAPQK